MRHHITLLGIALAVSMCLPISAFAVKAHIGYQCTDCHKAGANPRAMANVCTPCHAPTPVDGAGGAFTRDKASDALGNHPDHAVINYATAAPGDQTSHFWGGSTISAQAAAGVTPPPTTFYRSSYGISTNRITCSICHDPHGHAGTQLLRKTKVDDLICQQCHTGFYQDYPNAVVTHPVGATVVYADALAADVLDPGLDKYKLVPVNTDQGGIILVNGFVSCSSCHAPHFADSDSTTADGIANVAGLNKGDSHMLKANGPFATNNSLLCQTCHTYMAHGKMSDGGESVGCLTCHSAHIPVGNSNVYVLRNSVTTATYGTKTITYTSTNTSWNDNVAVTRTGYCEVCHGSAETIPKGAGFHQVGAVCRDCHLHQVEGGTYSFQNDANAASCGDCHGFPPYLNVRGDRNTGGTDGGFAYVSVAYNYSQDAVSGGYKNEVLTPHNTHAAGGMPQGSAATDYIFGTGVLACDPCHLDMSTAPTHDAGAPGSYQNLAWNSLSTGGGILTPSYATSGNASVIWKCSNTYCHSNGGKRDPDGTKELADYTLAVSPAWLAGDNVIIGNAGRCNFCHGNTAATMVSAVGQKYNSQSHQKHLGTGTFLKTYSCNACHSQTAASSTTLASVTPNPRLVKDGGKHVNGTPDVIFNSTFSLGSGTLGAASYNPGAAGTCTVYCHSNGRAPYTAIITADWDNAASGACGACHSTAAASLSAPHAKHLAIASVTCNSCHFTASGDATLGTHTGHVDGVFTFSQTACNNCHGYEAGETTPAWGQPMSNAYCLTCHTGNVTGILPTMTAPSKQHAATRGHNRTTNYPSGNLPGNKLCTSCHRTSITNHVNVTDGDATHLEAAATTCTATCHGAGGSAVGANTKGIVTHVSKGCTACHDPHGDTTLATNIYMIRSASSGNYSGTAVDFQGKTGVNSYDEDDGAAGNPGEINADDLCATCHTYNSGLTTGHNNKENLPTTASTSHYQGTNCFTSCHKTHKEAGGAFISGGGTQCNDCHGNPPLSNAQLKTYGQQYGAHAAHTFIGTPLPGEDRSDCEICHPGAATYSLSHSNGGGVVNLDPRITSLGGGNYSCGTLNGDLGCHASSATDGFWTDVDDAFYLSNGLNCTACHNASGTNDGVLANAAPNSGAHAKHRVANKICTDCHNNGVAITDTTHINSFGYAGAADDGAAIVDKASATLGEGTVLRNLTTYDQVTNFTCSGGIGLACHNSKVTPNWRTFTNITCTSCHNPTTSDAADPKTGLHNIGVTEAAAGVQKHDSTLPGGGCTACHNSTKPASHADGTFNNDTAVRTDRFLTVKAGMFVDNATANRGTCSGTGNLTGCHSDSGNWTRLWSTEANSTATASGSARCNVCHGQYSTLSGSGGRGWNAGTSHYKTYLNALSPRGSTHKSQAGENNACEDCHSYTTLTGNHDTVTHQITMNDDAVEVQVTEAAGRVYCAKCHATGDPLISGTNTFTQSIFPIQRVAGIHDPKQECNSCHGDGSGRYWPMSAYGAGRPENDAGRHEKHMARLAKSKYYPGSSTPVTDLLADVDTKNRQIDLCKFCHGATPGTNPGHNDTGLPADVSTTMYALWDTARATGDSITYTGTGANGTGTCANVNCHNEKNTNVLGATFAWHASGTGNCVLCHNDITNTTAGTTGATHQAHLAPTKFGRAVVCGDCHGATVSTAWSTYTEPATFLHINGQFSVTGGTVIDGTIRTYNGSYTNQAIRTPGTCGTNLCHNNGAGGTPYNGNGAGTYTWQTAMTDCTACHRNDTNLGSSHTPHLTAAVATFGKTPICVDCHEAVSATDMTGKANHINGAVTIASLAPMSAMTYSGAPGTLNVVIGGGNTYGACTGSCHTNGKAGGTPAVTATWNAAQAANCTICHLAPNTAGNDGARHSKHVGNTAKVPTSCGECHLNATTTTYNSANHLNSTVNTGNKISAHTNGTATCTNSCHLVDSARGDWLDTAALACTDCHSLTYIGKAAKNHLSGLHQATVALAHDDTFGASGTCTSCHNAITVDAPATHVNGLTTEPNTAYGLFASYNTGTSSCSGAGVATACHTDGGDWRRRWVGVTDAKPLQTNNPGDAVCNNCHGDHVNGWRWTEANATTVDHTDPNANSTDNVTSSHQVCQTCHGWGAAGYNRVWLGSSNATYKGHGDGHITLNGPLATGSGYDNTTGGCALSCHGDNATHRLKFNSGWTENYGDYGSANTCEACHAAKVAEAKHARHNNVSPTIATDLTDCVKCHPNAASYTPAGGHVDHKNTFVTLGNGIAGGATGCTAACHASNGTDGFWTDADGLNCTACHFADATPTLAENTGHARPLSATHNKHFAKGKLCDACHSVTFSPSFLSVVGPLAHITNTSGANQGAIFAGKAAAAQDEATITRAGTTFDDDGVDNILGNADDNTCTGGIGLGCHASGTPDWDNAITTCIVCHTNETDTNFNPTSGLHNFSTARRHDDTLNTGNCVNCHSSTSPSSLHQNGTKNNASTATFTWNANVTAYSVTNGCNATCHTDGGDWRRKWTGAVNAKPLNTNNPGDAVCDNCHGAPIEFDTVAAWRWNEANGTTVDHTNPYAGNGFNKMDQHTTCGVCHGWGNANYNRTWLGSSNISYVGHGDGHITMNGPGGTGTGYNNVSGGCAAACHTESLFVLNSNSGWTANFGNFGGGACDSCHGYPPLPPGYVKGVGNYEKGKVEDYPGAGSGHAIVKHLAKNILPASGFTPCSPCHYDDTNNHNMSGNVTDRTQIQVEIDPARDYKVPALYQKGLPNTVDGMGQCRNLNCHFTESPKWDCNP